MYSSFTIWLISIILRVSDFIFQLSAKRLGRRVYVLFVLGLVLPYSKGISQSMSVPDHELKYIQQLYEGAGVASPLTGQSYTIRELYAVNSPLYNELGPTPGYLIYDGIRYENETIQYDRFLKQVIILLKTAENESRCKEKCLIVNQVGKRHITDSSDDSSVI